MQDFLHDKKIHFMGIGGIGMSALAELSLARGAEVSGCDRTENENTARLADLGIDISIGHNSGHTKGIDIIVHTSAIDTGHPELKAAGKKAIKRGAFLARMMEGTKSIGVCGTHGKTSTTWFLAHILIYAGFDPTVFLGGIHPEIGGNLRIAESEFFVAELDESDGSFLLPKLDIAVITNVESEHLSHYGDFDNVRTAFSQYAGGVKKSGLLTANIDDINANEIFENHNGKKISIGSKKGADLSYSRGKCENGIQSFCLNYKNENLGRFSLPIPGAHNIINALCAIAVALELGVESDSIRRSLACCQSVERRMERVGESGNAVIYSDYAHHPTEVACAINSARQIHDGEILVVFQPHLYSRTRDYAEEFGTALAHADRIILTDIYPARETPLPGINSGLIASAADKAGVRVEGPYNIDDLPRHVFPHLKEVEAVILMGAGDIDKVRNAF